MASAFFQLELSPEQNDQVQRLATQRQLTPNGVLQEAVAYFLEEVEQVEQFRQDTLTALEEYKQTGLHATEEETFAWLEKLAVGERARAPKCHA